MTVLCCNILHKILKQKHNCDRISAEDLRSVGLFLFSILKNESAQEINQSVDNKFTSVLVQLISDVNKHCKHAIVALVSFLFFFFLLLFSADVSEPDLGLSSRRKAHSNRFDQQLFLQILLDTELERKSERERHFTDLLFD